MASEGHILTVFRSRLRDDANDNGYGPEADATEATARAMPGFVEFKSYAAPDGERVSIVVFDSWDTHQAWAAHPDHRAAQLRGRSDYYADYRITVTEVTRENGWPL